MVVVEEAAEAAEDGSARYCLVSYSAAVVAAVDGVDPVAAGVAAALVVEASAVAAVGLAVDLVEEVQAEAVPAAAGNLPVLLICQLSISVSIQVLQTQWLKRSSRKR